MKVATTTANLRPQNEVYLIGYVGEDRDKPAKGIHDDPLAVSLLMEIENEKYLFLSIDVIMLPENRSRIIKEKICDIFDIKYDHIIISAIHSHSASNGFNDIGALCKTENEEYFQYAIQQILKSLEKLEENLIEVKPFIGVTKVRGFYSNRNDIDKPFDDNATVVKFMSGTEIIAAFCNFNCHATVLGVNNMMVTSDLIGKVRELVGEQLGVIPYTFTGASGDISNRQYRQGNDFQELERVGSGVAEIINNISNFEEFIMNPVILKFSEHRVTYDNRKFHKGYREQLNAVENILLDESLSLDEWKLRTSEKLVLEDKLLVGDVDFKVTSKILHMGDLTIVTFPGELASKFGLQLRDENPSKHFLLIGYADDYQGYFIEAEEYGKTYETIASNTPKGETEVIIKEIGELL